MGSSASKGSEDKATLQGHGPAQFCCGNRDGRAAGPLIDQQAQGVPNAQRRPTDNAAALDRDIIEHARPIAFTGKRHRQFDGKAVRFSLDDE
jgi:hypothetical protein